MDAEEPGILSVCLYEDYAVRADEAFIVGNVFRIVCKGKRLELEYRKPVPFTTVKAKDLTVTLQVYRQSENCSSIFDMRQSYNYATEVPFTNVLSHVSLSMRDDGTLQMCAQELQLLTRQTHKTTDTAHHRQR